MAFQYQGHEAYGQPAPLEYGYGPEQQRQQQEEQQRQQDQQMQMLKDAYEIWGTPNAPMVGGGAGFGGAGGIAGAGAGGSFTGGGTMALGGNAAGSMAPGYSSGFLVGAPGGSGSLMSSPAMMGGGGATGGAAGGGGMGAGMAAAGPWAALAAAVIGYEKSAYDSGRRGDDTNDYLKSRATGKWLEQDAEYYSDKLFGDEDEFGLGATMTMGPNLLTGDFSNAFSDFDDSTIMKPIHLIGDLF